MTASQSDTGIRFPAWPPRWDEIRQSVESSLQSGDWGAYQSAATSTICDEIRQMFRVGHVRLLPSGSAAIDVALQAAGVGAGDEVIVSAYDYQGNFRAIELSGARPVLVDVAESASESIASSANTSGPPNSGSVSIGMDLRQVERAGSDCTKAVIASHLFGCAAPIAELREICDRRNWVLIEDACQVPGMLIDGSPAGGIGHLGTLSFGGSKPLTAGNGGALLTNDNRLAARLGPLLDRPSDAYPLSPLQAAVLQPQLARLKEMVALRDVTAEFLKTHIRASGTAVQLVGSASLSSVAASYYKMAFAAESARHRSEVISAAEKIGLPIGLGFRTTANTSDRRCRKPVSLDNSIQRSETLLVLDHTALMIDKKDHHRLADQLVKIFS